MGVILHTEQGQVKENSYMSYYLDSSYDIIDINERGEIMLTLLIGSDWTENRRCVLEQIAMDVRNERAGRILIVPELISHDTERRLCAAAGDTTSRFAEVLSFSRLAQRVSDFTHRGIEPCLDNGGRLVAMAAAVRQLHGKLKTYAALETRPEFLSGLIEAVDEFKRCCISPEDLKNASKQTEGIFAQKLEELSLILEAYDAVCSRGLRDPRDVMNWLLEQLEDSDFAQQHVFYIDGFPDFTRQHMAILEHIMLYAPHVVISLNCDEPNSKKPAFEKPGITAAEILRFAAKSGIPMDIKRIPERSDILQGVRRGVFQGTQNDVRLNDALLVAQGKTVYDECLIAAERVRNLIESGTRYKDISVVCADYSGYRNALDLAFQRCHIPIYQSGTEPILDKSAIITVQSAVDAATNGFEQEDIFRYGKSLMSPLDIAACDKIENYAIMWNVTGKHWLTEWTNHPKGLTEHWTDYDRKLLEQLNTDRRRIIDPLVHLQQGFVTANCVKEQVEAVYAFLEETRFPQRLAAMAKTMDDVGENREAQILNQLWEILLSALEQLHDVLGETGWDSEVFSRLLKLLLSQYDVGTIPPRLDAVVVGPVSAMRCQQAKHLIVLGAAEGYLPGYSGAHGVLTDQERTSLRDFGLPLTGGAMEGVQAEFSEIYGVFCGAEESVCITYSIGQPSSIYRRMLSLAGTHATTDTRYTTARADNREAAALFARDNDAVAAEDTNVLELYEQLRHHSQYQYGIIDPANVKALYGDKLHLSASQVDKQALCRFGYFLRYGLQAKERKTMTVDPAEFGTYVHAVLEETAKDVMAAGGFHIVSLERTMEIANMYAEQYALAHFSQLDSERLAYLFNRNAKELAFIVQEMWQELHNSEFVPVGFEVGFGEELEIGAIEIPSQNWAADLRGFVDRVDVWQSDHHSYFKVVDYKTGKKAFDYCDVLNGIGLQMLLYLFALADDGSNLLGEHPMVAGVQYFPARAPYILVDGIQDKDVITDNREKAWKRLGLLLRDEDVLQAMATNETRARLCYSVRKDGTLVGDLADSEQFKMLRAYVFALLGKIVDEIESGCVAPNPYTRGSADNACRFCPYGPICHPDNVDGRRNYKAVSSQKFWDDISKGVKVNG